MLSLLAAAAPLPASAGRLEGQAFLRQPFPLPADALLDVQLLEVARAGEPAVLRARSRSTPRGRSPYGFVLPYLDGSILPGRRYQLRATIHQADRLLFTSGTGLAWTGTTPGPLQLSLEPVGVAPLRGIVWLTAPAAGMPAPADAPRQEQQFQLNPVTAELTGSADCNRFIGTYRLEDVTLHLNPEAGTRLECEPAVIADEMRFLADLRSVRRWQLDPQGRLQLLDDNGQSRLLMETRPQ